MPITQYYTKTNVSFHEYQMYKYVYELSVNCEINVPKFITYNIETKTLVTEKIPNMSVSLFYGENITFVDDYTVGKIRDTVSFLYKNNIIYPDITGYNFIEYVGKVWIINFEHAHFTTNTKNAFVESFIGGARQWAIPLAVGQ